MREGKKKKIIEGITSSGESSAPMVNVPEEGGDRRERKGKGRQGHPHLVGGEENSTLREP